MSFFLRCIAAFLLFLSQQAVAAGPMTARDLLEVRRVVDVDISPDGRMVAYTLERMREVTEKPGSAYLELFLVSADSGISRGLLTGEERVTSPRWRPDGSGIAFLAKRDSNTHTQVWFVSTDGKELRCLTRAGTAVKKFRWSPDGSMLAYVAVEPLTAREEVLKEAGFGFVFYEENVKHRALFLIHPDEDGAEPRRLMEQRTVWDFVYSPEGTRLAVASSDRNLVDEEYMFQDISLLDLNTGTVQALVSEPNKIGNFGFSPDGTHLAYNGALERKDHKPSQVYVASVSTGQTRNLTPASFRGHVNWVGWRNNEVVRYAAGEGVESVLSEVPLAGGERTIVLSSVLNGVITTKLSWSADGRRMACVGETPDAPGEVYWFDGLKLKRLTENNPWLADRDLGRQEVIRYAARDGLEIEGLLLYPPGYRQTERYPLIVVVHGGPESHHSNGWVSSYARPGQVLAGNGYVVFYPNYRSSTGYGVEFAMQGHGDPAGKEFDDIADGIDHLVNLGVADRERVGLGGGSYGGYASAWFATYYTDYVRAVCMSVGVSDLISMAGTSDIPWEHVSVHWGKKLNEMWDMALERSPIYYAEKSRTATLIMGGLADTRVPPSQSLELFRMMKMNGHPAVRLVQYPGEGHGNSKQPGRIDMLYRTLYWYDWYVRDARPLNGPMPPLDISGDYGLELPAGEAEAVPGIP